MKLKHDQTHVKHTHTHTHTQKVIVITVIYILPDQSIENYKKVLKMGKNSSQITENETQT
jgi:hypothetical protein